MIIQADKQFSSFESGLSILAPAKINLSLLIAGKRPDGFHEIETIMAKINLYDEIIILNGQKPGIEIICKGPCWAPSGPENLVIKAAREILNKAGLSVDLRITLIKNIPAGSGLGSASSDAASTLIGLNSFLNLGFDNNSLSEMAASLGSDIPFFLNGPLALCCGKGEKIENLNEIFNFTALLIIPDINVSTKRVYENYKHDQTLYEQYNCLLNNYIQKNRIDLAAKECINMLEESCFNTEKALAELKSKIEYIGLKPCCMSGSGSSFYYLFDNNEESKAAEYQKKAEEVIGSKVIIVRNNRW